MSHTHSVPRVKMSAPLGRVAAERRRQIGRKIVATSMSEGRVIQFVGQRDFPVARTITGADSMTARPA